MGKKKKLEFSSDERLERQRRQFQKRNLLSKWFHRQLPHPVKVLVDNDGFHTWSYNGVNI